MGEVNPNAIRALGQVQYPDPNAAFSVDGLDKVQAFWVAAARLPSPSTSNRWSTARPWTRPFNAGQSLIS